MSSRTLHLPLVGLVLVGALVVAACGGGTRAGEVDAGDMPSGAGSASAAPGASAPAEPAGDVGSYADEALVAGAVDALMAHESFSYEVSSRGKASDDTEIRSTIRAIVRTSPEPARIVNFESQGSTTVFLTIGDRYWADLGDGRFRPQETPFDANLPETDGSSLQNLFAMFDSHFDDLIVTGHETTHGVPTVHLTIDPYIVEQRVEAFGEDERGWTLELYLAEDDGRLVRAVYGGPLANVGYFSLDDFAIDVKAVDCACPINEPS